MIELKTATVIINELQYTFTHLNGIILYRSKETRKAMKQNKITKEMLIQKLKEK